MNEGHNAASDVGQRGLPELHEGALWGRRGFLDRRGFLASSACGFGALALGVLCAEQTAAGSRALSVRPPHYRAPARRVIFLFMAGGPSHVDLFDYKPLLARDGGKKLPFKLPAAQVGVGFDATRLLAPVSTFHRQGGCGLPVSDLLPHLGRHADELCVLQAVQSDSPNHALATALVHTGFISELRPSMGAWVAYGLGTENENLPAYITILPKEDGRNYSSSFLPAIYQGTPLRSVGSNPSELPIRHLSDPEVAGSLQRRRVELIQAMNRRKLARLGSDEQIQGMIESFELAFRMQTETPKLVDISDESAATLKLYGIGEKPTDEFGRQCLLARRFAEAGVRFIQVSLGGWDHHNKIRSGLRELCAKADGPIAGLLADLKNRGLLDDTLVVWTGEFGRTPYSQNLSSVDSEVGRGHHPQAFTAWVTGGGVKGGIVHGKTDDYGYRGVEGKVHIHDLHATILHLLGLDHERLTYQHAGRDFRLTDVYGRVVDEIIA